MASLSGKELPAMNPKYSDQNLSPSTPSFFFSFFIGLKVFSLRFPYLHPLWVLSIYLSLVSGRPVHKCNIFFSGYFWCNFLLGGSILGLLWVVLNRWFQLVPLFTTIVTDICIAHLYFLYSHKTKHFCSTFCYKP